MKYITFSDQIFDEYKVCILTTTLNKKSLEDAYLRDFSNQLDNFIAYELYTTGKRTPAKVRKEYLDELIPVLQDLTIKYLLVTDADYFKTLTKQTKAEPHLGYVLPCIYDEGINVIYCPNHKAIFYNPEQVRSKIELALEALRNHKTNTYVAPGSDVIKFSAYPKSVSEIRDWLRKLYDMNVPLAADIETFSLKHYSAGIGSISFAWNQGEGIAFCVDLLSQEDDARTVRAYLKEFFQRYKQKIIWHNISFDVYVLIYQLFMEDLLDTEGLLDGLETMLSNWECTKLISYLATNSCAGNELGLKAQSHEFAGNYAVDDIKDITKIPIQELLEYNLIDALCTWFVYNKHYQTMLDDDQLDIYENLFKPAVKDIIQMQLTGLPLDMEEVLKAEAQLESELSEALHRILNHPMVQRYSVDRLHRIVEEKNASYKKKRITIHDIEFTFNPNSNDQLSELLYGEEYLNLPVIEKTANGNPSSDGDTLKKLLNHCKTDNDRDLIKAFNDYSGVAKILTAFIPHMKAAPKAKDGWHYLYGNFNLGGTVSGRLSSNNPNLQNLPAKSRYAKIIKKCFKAPPGWRLIGLDFASLEDRISALWTKDPNKIKVYTDGYDGHCLRAFSYFREQFPDIEDTVESINSIEKRYPELRQESKSPTFALTYQGTYITLIKNCGFSEELAKQVEQRYHELYKVSDQAVARRLQQATKDGYVTVAFGLRLRTPLLKQVVLGNGKTPHEAEAEGRTAGNAMGQSYCMLNTRAAIEFMGKVRTSDYRLDIRSCAQIHDAQYYLIRDDMSILMYVNEHLVKAVQWQEDPLIYHDEVKLGGEVSVFYPSWNEEVSIPNNATEAEIRSKLNKHVEDLKEKGIL